MKISKLNFKGNSRFRGLLFLFFLLFLGGCGQKWDGFFYPKGAQGEVVRSPISFSNKNDCLSWGIEKVRNSPNPEIADYECGRNCKTQDSLLGLFICDETVDG